jgi:hypothetical protein
MRVVEINEALLKKFPSKSRKELRFIIQGVVKIINRKLRRAYIVKFTVPKLGTFKTHGGRIKKNTGNIRKADRINKRKIALKKEFEKDNVLW